MKTDDTPACIIAWTETYSRPIVLTLAFVRGEQTSLPWVAIKMMMKKSAKNEENNDEFESINDDDDGDDDDET